MAKDQPAWQLEEIFSILIQCLRGLASLHAGPNTVIHRDMKPENILVASRERGARISEPGPWIKVADFGLARQGTTCRTQAGTWLYMAPEVFTGRSYGPKIDVWSVGVVILQLLLKGYLPKPTAGCLQGPQWCSKMADLAIRNCLNSHQHDSIHLTGKMSLNTGLYSLLADCMLKEDPSRRLSAQDCLNHPILLDIQSMLETSRGRNSGQQSDGNPSSSTAAQGNRQPSTKQLPPANATISGPLPEAIMRYIGKVPEGYDPGVDMAALLKDQESKGSKTATPEDPQPVAFGLTTILAPMNTEFRQFARKMADKIANDEWNDFPDL